MAFGNNRAAKQPRAFFRQAGGSTMTFRHPLLAGQLETTGAIDEVDISSCCKLDGRYFEATQNMDSAKQVVLVDSSVATITNTLLNGTITLPVVRTTGLVATGDFVSICQLIRASGDSVGGLLYKTDYYSGRAVTKMFYGVTVQRCPDDVSEGNDVAVYNVQLLYSGWIEAVTGSLAENRKRIWAVGNQAGISAIFSPYKVQNTAGNGGTEKEPINTANGYGAIDDDTSATGNIETYTKGGEFFTNAAKTGSDAWESGIIQEATQVTATTATEEGTTASNSNNENKNATS